MIETIQNKEIKENAGPFRIAFIGNPNCGKTTLFNQLTGLRARTANFAGTTVEHKVGSLGNSARNIQLIDLPGMYSLTAATPEEMVASEILRGIHPKIAQPDAVVVVVDASNLERNLFLVSQVLETDLPCIIALNMVDLARDDGMYVDPEKLHLEMGCPVIPMIARKGEGIDELRTEMLALAEPDALNFHWSRPEPVKCDACASCPYQSRFSYTEEVTARVVKNHGLAKPAVTEKLDRVFTHPFLGVVSFFAVMAAIFFLIFRAASIPMDLIDGAFASVGDFLTAHMPEGHLRSLLVDGIIGGVGGILIFVPQIAILFFALALLDETGYLSRAAFVMDKLMRHIGLPGNAFVPLVSAHACAIPAIMATRVISDRRDRLVTILVLPLMTCSARIPVYAMISALLFPHDAVKAALLFTGAYGLGIVAALIMAFVFKKTILPGESKPLIMELPVYKVPSIRSGMRYALDRTLVFIRQAGTTIFVISVILWFLATFPTSQAPEKALALAQQAETMAAAGQSDQAEALAYQAATMTQQHALSHSFAGQLGHIIEPVVKPLGFDWQIGIGIVSSFAAREVIVSTLAIVYGVGEKAVEDNTESLYDSLRRATRKDGTPIFTTATSVSLLIFYVLAMQCLPTQVITKRETGSWKWALFQLGYMSILAYSSALVAYQGLRALGVS